MKRRTFSTILSVIVVLVLIGLGAYYVKNNGSFSNPNAIIKDAGPGISDYSAVFLTNGQVYFGKINAETSDEINLSDIYYLQVNQAIQNSGTSSSTSNSNDNTNVVLVKLGNELHGPNDRMHINREQVLFTESLKTDSKVITAINNYQNK